MLDPTWELFPKNSKFSFEFEKENIETNSIGSILKDFYGPD